MNHYDQIDQTDEAAKMRRMLIEGVLELNDIKKYHSDHQRELLKSELRLSQVKDSNRSLKKLLMLALIENEKVASKNKSLVLSIERIAQQIDDTKRETDTYLKAYQIPPES